MDIYSGQPPVPIHKLGAVWCSNCDSYHVECQFGCCYLDSEQQLVFDVRTGEDDDA